MVIGLLVVSAIPTTIGICQGLSAQKKANAAAKEKAKFHLTTTLCLDGSEPVECWCILKDGKVSPCIHPSSPPSFTGESSSPVSLSSQHGQGRDVMTSLSTPCFNCRSRWSGGVRNTTGTNSPTRSYG